MKERSGWKTFLIVILFILGLALIIIGQNKFIMDAIVTFFSLDLKTIQVQYLGLVIEIVGLIILLSLLYNYNKQYK